MTFYKCSLLTNFALTEMFGMKEKLLHFLNPWKEINEVIKIQHNYICFDEILITVYKDICLLRPKHLLT